MDATGSYGAALKLMVGLAVLALAVTLPMRERPLATTARAVAA